MQDFNKDLEFSLGERERIDCDIIKKCILNCVNVIKTDKYLDKKGIDYVATLDGGAKVNIDAKARRKGAVKYGCEPPLALEIWSVMPNNSSKGKPGWTCNRETNVDMILYTFDKSECDKFYLIPYQSLRIAFQKHCKDWMRIYKPRIQHNAGWNSMAIFVPANIVLQAVCESMEGVRNR